MDNNDPVEEEDENEEKDNVTMEDLNDQLYELRSSIDTVRHRQQSQLEDIGPYFAWICWICMLWLAIRTWMVSEEMLSKPFACSCYYLNGMSYPL